MTNLDRNFNMLDFRNLYNMFFAHFLFNMMAILDFFLFTNFLAMVMVMANQFVMKFANFFRNMMAFYLFFLDKYFFLDSFVGNLTFDMVAVMVIVMIVMVIVMIVMVIVMIVMVIVMT